MGSDSVTASYSGSPDFLSSSSDATSVVVTKAATTLGLLAATDTSTPGTPTTLTANVFPSTGSGETGTVTFFENGERLGMIPGHERSGHAHRVRHADQCCPHGRLFGGLQFHRQCHAGTDRLRQLTTAADGRLGAALSWTAADGLTKKPPKNRSPRNKTRETLLY